MRKTAEKTQAWPNWQDTNSFAERMVWARTSKNLTQQGLADAAGIKQQSIQKAEKPTAQGSSYTPQIASAVGINALWLASGEGEPYLTLHDLPQGALDVALAMFSLPQPVRDAKIHDVLATALSFIHFSHPRRKGIESIYLELSGGKLAAHGAPAHERVELAAGQPGKGRSGKEKTK